MAPGESGGDGRHTDYYDILGVPRTASRDDITRAYRRLARQHHPDHNPAAESKRFQEITDAYGVIGDADRRRRYDADRRHDGAGRGVRIPVRGAGAAGSGPGEATVNRPVIRVPAELAAAGTIAVMDVTDERPCTRCDGSGLERPEAACASCAGAGAVTRRMGQIPIRHICSACGGRGRAAARPCTACDASGSVARTRPLKVRVPAGVRDGATLRIRPKGTGRPFDAVVRVV